MAINQLPSEMILNIKNFLDTPSLGKFNVTDTHISNCTEPKRYTQARKCGVYQTVSKDKLSERERCMLLFKCEHLSCMKYLIEEVGLTLEDIRYGYNHAFNHVCKEGRLDIVLYYISLGINIEDIRNNDDFIIRLMCKLDNLDVIKIFVKELGLSCEHISLHNDFIVRMLMKCDPNLRLIKYFIEELKITFTRPEVVLSTAIHYNRIDMLTYLLNVNGIFHNDLVQQYRIRILNYAVVNCNLETIKFLYSELHMNVEDISSIIRIDGIEVDRLGGVYIMQGPDRDLLVSALILSILHNKIEVIDYFVQVGLPIDILINYFSRLESNYRSINGVTRDFITSLIDVLIRRD